MAGTAKASIEAPESIPARTRPIRTHTPSRIRSPDGKERAVPLQMAVPEFEKFPWPEGERWELIWGVPVISAAPLPSHQDVIGRVYRILCEVLEPREFTILSGVAVLTPDRKSYLVPDVSVFEGEVDMTERPFNAVPKLVVESLSPSTRGNDEGSKLEAFAAAGIPEYWVVNPANGALSILVNPHDLTYDETVADADGFVRSTLLGLSVRVRRHRSRFAVETRP